MDTSLKTAKGRLEPGSRAPDFSLPDASGNTVQLSNLLGKGPIALYFDPKDNTKGCTVEACAFRNSYEVFQVAGAEVVGVSTDDEALHQAFAEQNALPFILLSDEGGAVSREYGATALFGLMAGRVTFVIDASGVVRHVFTSMFNATRHVDEALEVVRRLQREGAAPRALSLEAVSSFPVGLVDSRLCASLHSLSKALKVLPTGPPWSSASRLRPSSAPTALASRI